MANIELISSAGREIGQWIVYTKDEKFTKLKNSLLDYGNEPPPDKKREFSNEFLDFVNEIKPILLEQKQKPPLSIESVPPSFAPVGKFTSVASQTKSV